MVLPVRTRAKREKSLCRSAFFSNTFSYISRCGRDGRRVTMTTARHQSHPRWGGHTRTYQFGGAAAGEDAPGTLDVEVARAPAAHVEPLDGAGRAGPILAVQENQLLQRPHRRVLQHLLQLWKVSATRRGRGCPTTAKPDPSHLSQRRFLVAQAHDEDAVGLADAAHGPRCEGAVGLVEDDAVDVLLLRQPPRQPVLVDAARMEGSSGGTAVVTHRGHSD